MFSFLIKLALIFYVLYRSQKWLRLKAQAWVRRELAGDVIDLCPRCGDVLKVGHRCR